MTVSDKHRRGITQGAITSTGARNHEPLPCERLPELVGRGWVLVRALPHPSGGWEVERHAYAGVFETLEDVEAALKDGRLRVKDRTKGGRP